LLNPLYLAGDFGVTLAPTALVEQRQTGGFETYENNRLPFYSGVIEYALDAEVPVIPDGDLILADIVTDLPFYEACEVAFNPNQRGDGATWHVLAWEPRCVELPAGVLRAGRNEVIVRVYTTLLRAFEGKWFDYVNHCYRNIEPCG
jgi:hypothetical protein